MWVATALITAHLRIGPENVSFVVESGWLRWMAAGWGAMIGMGVSGALGGCLGCFLLEWSLKVQRAKKNKSNVGV